jgi:hypothetical protein
MSAGDDNPNQGAPAANHPEPRSPTSYRLSSPASAFGLKERPGSWIGDSLVILTTGTVVDIPAQAIVELEGAPAPWHAPDW